MVWMKNQLSLYVFISVLFVAGVGFGVLLVHALSLEQQQDLATDVGHYFQMIEANLGATAQQSFWERLLFHSKWLLLLWILGITVVGIPGVLALNFLKGTLIGFSFGTLIQQFGWKGMLLSLLSIAPQNVIIVPAMIITSAAALGFSLYVIKNRLLSQQGTLMPQLLSYCSSALLMLFVFVCAALFEAYVSPALIRWGAPALMAVVTY